MAPVRRRAGSAGVRAACISVLRARRAGAAAGNRMIGMKRASVSALAVAAACLAAGGALWAEAPSGASSIYESSVKPTPVGGIDRIVFAQLEKLGIKPVLCSDAVFVRRAYLDVIGMLPTAKEVRAFLQDKRKDKRQALIDRLLARPEFADYWSMKWGDILRIKAEFPVNLWPNAAQAYHRWVRASIESNKPYDQFIREMLTASGSNFRVGPVNFYRAVQAKTPASPARAAALTFMGSRTDYWPKGRLEGVAVFFSQVGYKPTSEWKEECVFWDPLGSTRVSGNAAPGHATPTTLGRNAPKTPKFPPPKHPAAPPPAPRRLRATFPDGKTVTLNGSRDPREVFADWLIDAKNPWFARSYVNRVWAWLIGRGIVHEPDDFRPDNPPADERLLAYLAREFVASKYDTKSLYRLILTSQTYQLSSLSRGKGYQADGAAYATYQLRRLDAEVLVDAVNRITGTTDLYTSAIPEPFTYIPRDLPAIAVADGSITSPFLTLFGRSARATGMALERDSKTSPSQWLHMLNSSHIQQKLDRSGKLKALYTAKMPAEKVLEELYLTVLSRRPTAAETKAAMAYTAPSKWRKPTKSKSTRDRSSKSGKYKKPAKSVPVRKSTYDWIDITWALLNSPEFLYGH